MHNAANHLAGLITEKFISADPASAARALAALATHEVILLIGGLKAEVVIACLNAMETPKAAAVLRRLPIRQAAHIFARLNVPQAVAMMKEFSPAYREKMTSELKPGFASLLAAAASYPSGSVGDVMRTEFTPVKTEEKVADVLARLKVLPRKKLPEVCFVLAKDGVLKGVLRTAELAFCPSTAAVGSVMQAPVAAMPQTQTQEAVIKWLESGLSLLPVVNEQGVLLGVAGAAELQNSAPAKEAGSFWRRLTK